MVFDTVIIGAGLTGLRQALVLYADNRENVLIIDYEEKMGGFYSDNGILEKKEDRKIVAQAENLPYAFWGKSTAIDIETDENVNVLTVQTEIGSREVKASQIIITTGTLEKPRGANWIPGSRPASEMTPSLALSFIERGYIPGMRPLIIIDNDISQIVADRLKDHPDCQVTKEYAKDVEILDIEGDPRVTGVRVLGKNDGKERKVSCDSFIYSHGKMPNTAFLRMSDIGLDDLGFIRTNAYGETTLPGIYAYGDCAVQVR
ncbi:NAD(P)/FAD-dependent oxidoreductase [Salinicoccus albus]|uniref:NAD(P)/FAD-dependent oxidoreductase n=1 Tax=Salinicoccus albus TaxID=418756 RepID=UPI0003717A57|nr:FAD-dependent oxidoreductase [Salinicoccus albus]